MRVYFDQILSDGLKMIPKRILYLLKLLMELPCSLYSPNLIYYFSFPLLFLRRDRLKLLL